MKHQHLYGETANSDMESEGHNCFHGIVKGRVQGVGYRVFALQAAQRHGISGWVRNLPNGCVEVCAQGEELALTEFLTELYRGPIMGHVEEIDLTWEHTPPEFKNFEIRR